jgi:hypothetical protein
MGAIVSYETVRVLPETKTPVLEEEERRGVPGEELDEEEDNVIAK